jgi:hypothetical protein
VAVLLAFSLLLTLLRQSRTHAQEPIGPAPLGVPALPAAVTVPIALPPAPEMASPSASASARTEALPVLVETSPGDVPPTRADPVLADAADEANAWEAPTREVPAPEAPAAEGPTVEVPTAEVPVVGAPTVAAPVVEAPAVADERDEPAPPTVQVPALPPEPALAEAAPTRAPQGIRYAGNGVPGMAGKQADERDEDWETEEAGPFAGLVYPAREDHADAAEEGGDSDDANDDSGDTETDEPGPRGNPQELDDDLPPFATAPFAPVPRLNRVRSTPVPPADEDD